MTARSMTFAAQLTRTWVALYTAGLPEEPACTRRGEIESDLWEQELAGGVSNGEALARLVFGVPADLSWRLEQRQAFKKGGDVSSGPKKGRPLMQTITQRAFVGTAWLMAAFTVTIAALVAFGLGEGEVLGVYVPRAVWAVVGILAGAAILAGVRASSASPVVGGILVISGALPLAFIMSWSVVVPVLWLLLAVLLVAKALHLASDCDRIASA